VQRGAAHCDIERPIREGKVPPIAFPDLDGRLVRGGRSGVVECGGMNYTKIEKSSINWSILSDKYKISFNSYISGLSHINLLTEKITHANFRN
jgi:hypothetical protein